MTSRFEAEAEWAVSAAYSVQLVLSQNLDEILGNRAQGSDARLRDATLDLWDLLPDRGYSSKEAILGSPRGNLLRQVIEEHQTGSKTGASGKRWKHGPEIGRYLSWVR